MTSSEQLAQAALRAWFCDDDGFKNMSSGNNRKAAQAIAALQAEQSIPEYHEWVLESGGYVRRAAEVQSKPEPAPKSLIDRTHPTHTYNEVKCICLKCGELPTKLTGSCNHHFPAEWFPDEWVLENGEFVRRALREDG